MKVLTHIVAIGLLSIHVLFAQPMQQTFEISALGKKIGSSTVSSYVEGEDIHYLTKSLLEVNLLIKKIRMKVENNTCYRAGKLHKSEVKVIVNGDLHTSSLIKWMGRQYSILVDGKTLKPEDKSISYSGSLLYFKEPKNIRRAFSESSGIYMPVKELKKGQYQVTDPHNDRDTIHYYENGQLVKLVVKHPLVNVYMHLRESDLSMD